jgi:hypothetical protein
LVDEGRVRDQTPYLTWGLPTAIAVKDLAVELPELADAIVAFVPDGGYWAVVLAAGGASMFPMPELP